ncbi:probable G-protein coupled receptor Mth-like 10 isoform X5 [Euwallacea fornicatus]|uniref:probable G-protein coupled receptor Mth-like 10 isoform X5 n=1 Tax=Euwallacea fornicatus TaxID=995702 RepID=UPI00338F59F3
MAMWIHHHHRNAAPFSLLLILFLLEIVLVDGATVPCNDTDSGGECPKIRKCCPLNQELRMEDGNENCANTTKSFKADLHRDYGISDKYDLVFGTECSARNSRVFISYNDMFLRLRLEKNGSLLMTNNNNETMIMEVHAYCLDYFNHSEFINSIICTPNSMQYILLHMYGMIISMPFLLVTFVVYALLPDRNLHQKALMFYVLTLLIAYILLVTINLSNEILMPWCSVIAYATIFSFMSSFFWMNVICFDIWYTFSGGRGFVGSKRSTERRRLIYYSLYALGGPLLILGLIGLMQTVLPDDSNHNPNIGVKMCFLNDGWANLWYFYLEAGILVLVNVIFFTLTALKIRKVKKETSMLNHNDSKRHSYEKDKQKDQRAIYGFNLYIKLLFAMGVNWSMEVISWAINWRTANELQYIWYVTDTFNAIYGVFIFFIFVFKKKIWSLLQKRYYNFIGKPHLAHTVTTNQTRTSHYSSTNYSTADTQLTDTNGRPSPEEMGLRTLS